MVEIFRLKSCETDETRCRLLIQAKLIFVGKRAQAKLCSTWILD